MSYLDKKHIKVVKPKHVLFSLDFPPKSGGVASFLCHRLNNSDGIDLAVVTVKEPGWKDYENNLFINIYRYTPYLNNIMFVNRFFQFSQSLFHISKTMRSAHVDVLESGTALPGTFCGWILKKLYPIKLATFVHGNDILRPQKKFFTAWMLKKGLEASDLIIANSVFTAGLVKKFGIEDNNILIINPPIDTKRFAPNISHMDIKAKYNLKEKHILLTVSRLYSGRKGFETLLQSLKSIKGKFPNIKLIIVGDGPAREALESRVLKLQLGENVIFSGYVSDHELPAYYCASDIFVMVSDYDKENGDVEGYGIVYDEAHACQIPCIAANVGGAPEAVHDGVDGLIVPPGDHKALANAIEKLLTNKDYADLLGKNGRNNLFTKTYEWHVLNKLGM